MNNLVKLAVLLVCALYLGGCAGGAIKNTYYRLDSAAQTVNRDKPEVQVRVNLAPLLETANLVFQPTEHEVYFAQHHFWAEPLDFAIAKALAAKLNARDTEHNYTLDAGAGAAVISLWFDSFHSMPNSMVVAAGTVSNQGGAKKSTWFFALKQRQVADGYGAMVESLQTLLEQLADCIIADGCSKY